MNKIINNLKLLIKQTVIFSGLEELIKYINRNKARILTYHGVNDYQDKFNWNYPNLIVNKYNFDEQMRYLADNYNVISLSQLTDCLITNTSLPDNSAIITFDDGLRNIYTNAFPILKKYKLPATLFLPTNFIGTNKIYWINKYCYIINSIGIDRFIVIFKKKYSNDLKKEFIKDNYTIQSIEDFFKYKVDATKRDTFFDNLYNQFKPNYTGEENDVYLTWDEVAKMKRAGLEFGSHTLNHSALSALNNKDIYEELAKSKKIIKDKLKSEGDLFSYPFGYPSSHKNNYIKSTISKLGYKSALTTNYGFVKQGNNLFELNRITIRNEPISDFSLRINGYYFTPSLKKLLNKK